MILRSNDGLRRVLAPLARITLAGTVLALGFSPVTAQTAQSARFAPTATLDCDRGAVEHLLRRATYGIRVGDVERVCTLGVEGWVDAQLTAGSRPAGGAADASSELATRLAALPAAGMSMLELRAHFPPPQELQRLAESEAIPPRERQARSPARLQAELASARLIRAVHAEAQLAEVMTAFWFDHFNVHFQKGPIRWMVADYEATAIRPHVFGRFHDMLRATARHPAMLTYLDNVQNVAADSMRPPLGGVGAGARGGARAAAQAPPIPQALRQAGGNENYARELLELHTVGVHGGYSESDVQAVARAFTGWGAAPLEPPNVGNQTQRARLLGQTDSGSFQFRAPLHDIGEKTVLGMTLPGGRGEADGEDVLRLLSTHPSTARHLASKLVQRFVHEGGDPELEAHLASVFLDTDGDLGALTRALFVHPRFQAPEFRTSLFRTPFEFVAASARAVNAEVGLSNAALRYLRDAGHVPYAEVSPAGPPVEAAHWATSAALLSRMEFARALTSGQVNGVRPQPGAGAAMNLRGGGGRPQASIVAILFPEGVPSELATDDPRTLLTLGLGGPAFQRK